MALRYSVFKLVAEGIIDPERFASVYQGRGGLLVEVRYMLIWATHLPIHLTEGNADYYVTLLWPLGLANYMSANESSPMNGDSLYNFARSEEHTSELKSLLRTSYSYF